MNRVVIRSIEDATGLRCVDIVLEAPGRHSWQECRRDPEDDFGWRVVGHAAQDHASAAGALADARRVVGWLSKENAG